MKIDLSEQEKTDLLAFLKNSPDEHAPIPALRRSLADFDGDEIAKDERDQRSMRRGRWSRGEKALDFNLVEFARDDRKARSKKNTLSRLRRNLPLLARGKPALMSFLKSRAVGIRTLSRLLVTDVFDAGGALGLNVSLRHIRSGEHPHLFVAPLTQIAFTRSEFSSASRSTR